MFNRIQAFKILDKDIKKIIRTQYATNLNKSDAVIKKINDFYEDGNLKNIGITEHQMYDRLVYIQRILGYTNSINLPFAISIIVTIVSLFLGVLFSESFIKRWFLDWVFILLYLLELAGITGGLYVLTRLLLSKRMNRHLVYEYEYKLIKSKINTELII